MAPEVKSMPLRRCVVVILSWAVLGVGCVSRTIERRRRIGELPRAGAEDRGTVTSQRLIWIWEPEFWDR